MTIAQSTQSIWNDPPSLPSANELSRRSLIGHLGIELVEVGEDYLKARDACRRPHPATDRGPARRRLGHAGGDPRPLGGDLHVVVELIYEG